MNRILSSLLFVVAGSVAGVLPVAAQAVHSSGGISPHETISQVFGKDRASRVILTYGRPFAKDPTSGAIRDVWGKLIPDDAKQSANHDAWRAGSDEATTLVTQKAIMVGSAALAPGAYTLYMVPSATGTSQLAISSSLGQWGIPVDEKHDIARVDLTKAPLDPAVDEYTMALDKDPSGSITLKLMWQGTQFSVPITLQK